MTNYKPVKEEMETQINYSRVDDMATLWSSDPIDIRRFTKLANEDPNVTILRKDEYSTSFYLPKKYIGLIRSRPIQDPEQKAALVERLAKGREAKRNKAQPSDSASC